MQNTRLKASERWWPTCRLIEPQSLLRRPLIVLLLVILRLIMADDATCRRSEETVTGSESKTPMIRAQRTRNARKGAPAQSGGCRYAARLLAQPAPLLSLALSSALAKRRKPLFAASDNFAQRFFTWFAEISEVTLQAGFNAAASWLNTCAILFDVGRTLFGDCSSLEHDGQAVF